MKYNFFLIRLVLLVAKVPKTIQDSKTRYRPILSPSRFHPAQTVAVLKTRFLVSSFSGLGDIPEWDIESESSQKKLFRTLIHLIQSKDIFIIIEEVSLPALSWYSEFRNCDHTTIREDFLLHRIEVLYLHRTHKGICRSLHVLIPRCLTLHQSTHHPARLNTIVGDRNMRIQLK